MFSQALFNIIKGFFALNFLKEVLSFGFITWIFLAVLGVFYVVFKPLVSLTVSIAKSCYYTFKYHYLCINKKLDSTNSNMAIKIAKVESKNKSNKVTETEINPEKIKSKKTNNDLINEIESSSIQGNTEFEGSEYPFPTEEPGYIYNENVELVQGEKENLDTFLGDQKNNEKDYSNIVPMNKNKIEYEAINGVILPIKSITFKDGKFVAIVNFKGNNIEVDLNKFGIEAHQLETRAIKVSTNDKLEVIKAESAVREFESQKHMAYHGC